MLQCRPGPACRLRGHSAARCEPHTHQLPESLAAPRLELTGLRLSRGLSQIPGSGTHPHPVEHRLARDPEPTFLLPLSLSAPTAP